MGINGLIIGIAIFILTMSLASAVPVYLSPVPAESLDLIKIFFLFIGAGSIFIGAKS